MGHDERFSPVYRHGLTAEGNLSPRSIWRSFGA
jgi:hypothetical protein